MSERLRLWALLIPLLSLALGILTAVPGLFAFLGLATYAALMRECFRHVVPWKWARRALFLDRVRRTRNPSPPPPEGPSESTKPQVTKLAGGSGFIVYPEGRRTEKIK